MKDLFSGSDGLTLHPFLSFAYHVPNPRHEQAKKVEAFEEGTSILVSFECGNERSPIKEHKQATALGP